MKELLSMCASGRSMVSDLWGWTTPCPRLGTNELVVHDDEGLGRPPKRLHLCDEHIALVDSLGVVDRNT